MAIALSSRFVITWNSPGAPLTSLARLVGSLLTESAMRRRSASRSTPVHDVANERLEIRFFGEHVAVVADGAAREPPSELGVRHGDVDGAPRDFARRHFLLGALQPP